MNFEYENGICKRRVARVSSGMKGCVSPSHDLLIIGTRIGSLVIPILDTASPRGIKGVLGLQAHPRMKYLTNYPRGTFRVLKTVWMTNEDPAESLPRTGNILVGNTRC